ncbi:MAG: hypothetical protein VCD00_12985 [Candidatus Hydrogenedentota bacterium]
MINASFPMSTTRAGIVAFLVCALGSPWFNDAFAQESSADKREVITFDNSDVKDLPPIIVLRDRPKPRVNTTEELEDAEGFLDPDGEKEDVIELDEDGNPIINDEVKAEKEKKIVDSFVILKGNRRFHLSSCPLVVKTKRDKTTLNGAAVIKGKYYSCSICKPPAPMKNPPKADGSKSELGKVTKPKGSALAPKGRTPKPESKKVEPSTKSDNE